MATREITSFGNDYKIQQEDRSFGGGRVDIFVAHGDTGQMDFNSQMNISAPHVVVSERFIVSATATIAAGNAVTSSGILADSTDGTKVAIGLAVAGAASGQPCTVITKGLAKGVLTAATAGVKYWLGTAGAITSTQPVTSAHGQCIVGYALNATDLFVSISDLGVHA